VNITGETRKASYNDISNSGTAATRRNIILGVIGNRQMTATEILDELERQGVVSEHDPNFVRPRLTELKQMGIIHAIDKRVCSKSGKKVAVWSKKDD